VEGEKSLSSSDVCAGVWKPPRVIFTALAVFFFAGMVKLVPAEAGFTLVGGGWKVRSVIESGSCGFWLILLPFLLASDSVCYISVAYFVVVNVKVRKKFGKKTGSSARFRLTRFKYTKRVRTAVSTNCI